MRLRRALLIALLTALACLAPLSARAQSAPKGNDAPATMGAAGPVEKDSRLPPLSDLLSPWHAATIGALGSAAYLVVVWVGLLGTSDGRSRVLHHFKALWGVKVPVYVASGAGVALVFQLPEAKLVPVQAFIIGCTWPAVVANYLSGRQAGEGESQALEAFKKQQEAERLQAVAAAVPEPRQPTPQVNDQLDALIASLSDGKPAAGQEGDGND